MCKSTRPFEEQKKFDPYQDSQQKAVHRFEKEASPVKAKRAALELKSAMKLRRTRLGIQHQVEAGPSSMPSSPTQKIKSSLLTPIKSKTDKPVCHRFKRASQ